jgi:hypothetical protein
MVSLNAGAVTEKIMNQIRKVRFQPPISLDPTFLIAKMQQQRFKLIGPYRLEDDTGAAIQNWQ